MRILKILYISTISNTIDAFLIPHIRALIEDGHQVDLAFNIVRPVNSELIDLGCKIHELPFERSPLSRGNLNAYKGLKKIIKDYDYKLIHTFTPIASFLTRLAWRNEKNIKVVYSAFGFHFFKGAPLKNWIIYYPLERFVSRYTHTIITTNREDYNRAKRSFKAKNIKYAHGTGLDIERFKDVKVNKAEKLKPLGVSIDDFIVLSVGELNRNKNHETIIRAIDRLKDDSIKYLICGEGLLEEYLNNLIKKLGLENQVKLLGQRSDVQEIYAVSDVLALPSRREGLGMVSLEAMVTGIPIITSNIHGILDYSIDGVTGFLCDPMDIDCFSKSIKKLKDDPELREKMGENNKTAADDFKLENSLAELALIYKNIMEEGNSNGR